jgi:Domain of unknown function (DUF5664)
MDETQMTTETKPTNPKDAIGSKRLAMHLVPDCIPAYAAIAFTEGALKYGKYNWRVAGVRVSIYLDAARRHLAAYQNGEWADAKTRVPHLASVIACVGIILDAGISGKLTDDRPPAQEIKPLLDGQLMEITAHLQKLFEGHTPHQHTIMDDQRERAELEYHADDARG